MPVTVDVTCPHCAAAGQIQLPSPATIIVGPCPECNGMVAVFCGAALALDQHTMLQGESEERRDHVVAVLTEFIRERVGRLFPRAGMPDAPGDRSFPANPEAELHVIGEPGETPVDAPITPEEVESFRTIDLRLLDNSDYFHAIFGGR